MIKEDADETKIAKYIMDYGPVWDAKIIPLIEPKKILEAWQKRIK